MNLKLNLPFQHLNAHAQVLHKVLLLYMDLKNLLSKYIWLLEKQV